MKVFLCASGLQVRVGTHECSEVAEEVEVVSEAYSFTIRSGTLTNRSINVIDRVGKEDRREGLALHDAIAGENRVAIGEVEI